MGKTLNFTVIAERQKGPCLFSIRMLACRLKKYVDRATHVTAYLDCQIPDGFAGSCKQHECFA